MKRRPSISGFLTSALVSTLITCVAATRLAAEDYTLDQWTLGEVVAGDKLDLDNLEGRVVALEFWGTR